ncbi:hypothetical protein ACU8KH_05199 [Lachancea thermotolerans]
MFEGCMVDSRSRAINLYWKGQESDVVCRCVGCLQLTSNTNVLNFQPIASTRHGFCQVLSLLLLSYLIPRPSPPKVLLGPLVDRTHNDTHALCSITDGQVVFALVASRQTRNRQQLRELDEKLQQTSCSSQHPVLCTRGNEKFMKFTQYVPLHTPEICDSEVLKVHPQAM